MAMKPREEQSLLLVGKVLRPYGLKGEMAVCWLLEDEAGFAAINEVLLKLDNDSRIEAVSALRRHGKLFLLSLKGIGDRTTAGTLSGAEIYIQADLLHRPDSADIFLHELIGCRVELFDGRYLGQIREIMTPVGQEIWVIITEDSKEILFPAVPEFIDAKTIDNRLVRINPPDGLLELYS